MHDQSFGNLTIHEGNGEMKINWRF